VARNRASAKKAGSDFERQQADCLALHVDDRIDRKVKTGALDKGDIANLRAHNQKVTVEVKNYGGQIKAAEWAREGATERENDKGLAWVVIAKRKGTTDPLKQWVLMEVGELIALINGNRDHMEVEKS
jgi:hypothetical protein